MEAFALARVMHMLGVVLWIGGVAFVTTVLLPAVGRIKHPGERIAFFTEIERGFARQARITTVLTGASGFWLTALLHAWPRFHTPAYWWMTAMVGVWALFTVMLFVLEPMFLHRWFESRAQHDPEGTFRLVQRLHWGLLLVSLLTIAGAVAGAHGWLLGVG